MSDIGKPLLHWTAAMVTFVFVKFSVLLTFPRFNVYEERPCAKGQSGLGEQYRGHCSQNLHT